MDEKQAVSGAVGIEVVVVVGRSLDYNLNLLIGMLRFNLFIINKTLLCSNENPLNLLSLSKLVIVWDLNCDSSLAKVFCFLIPYRWVESNPQPGFCHSEGWTRWRNRVLNQKEELSRLPRWVHYYPKMLWDSLSFHEKIVVEELDSIKSQDFSINHSENRLFGWKGRLL